MTEGEAQVDILFRFLQKRRHCGRRAIVYVLWWVEVLSCGHFATVPAHEKKLRKTTCCGACLYGDVRDMPGALEFESGGFNSDAARRQRKLLYKQKL